MFGNRKNQSQDIDVTTKPAKKRGAFGTYVHYAVMPGIGQRIRGLGRHFSHFAYLIALIYQAVRLIPANHPVLNPNNIGTFGFRDVFKVASDNLVLKRENLDQILMYFAVMAGFLMIIIQLFLILAYVGSQGVGSSVAFAQSTGAGSGSAAVTSSSCTDSNTDGLAIFSTPCPNTDTAFQMLRNVFGTKLFEAEAKPVPGVLSSQAVTDAYNELSSANNPLVKAFQSMLGLFSNAMLLIAVLIILYYVFTVVGEAAISGTPFGKRFDGFWAPLRIVFALGILVPIGSGYNLAQYGTLYIAKTGSGLASNAWVTFYKALNDNFSGLNTALVGGVVFPEEVVSLIEGIIVAETCSFAWESKAGNHEPVHAYVAGRLDERVDQLTETEIGAYTGATGRYAGGAVGNVNYNNTGIGWTVGRSNTQRGLRFIYKTNGTIGQNKKPVCGEITIPINQLIRASSIASRGSSSVGESQKDAIRTLQEAYISTTLELMEDENVKQIASRLAGTEFSDARGGEGGGRKSFDWPPCAVHYEEDGDGEGGACPHSGAKNYRDALIEKYAEKFLAINETFRSQFENEVKIETKKDISLKGWAAAGLWYNQISKLNGQFFDAQYGGFPAYSNGPQILEKISRECARDESSGQVCSLSRTRQHMRNVLETTEVWLSDSPVIGSLGAATRNHKTFFESALAFLFGIERLYAFKDTIPTNPISELALIGKDMVGRSFLMFTTAAGLQVIGSAANIAKSSKLVPGPARKIFSIFGPIATGIAGLLFFIAFISLGIGFLLFYVIPLMPFIYFFFAVAAWIGEIFEAIVAMPLFALAHVRIDGGGLPGQAASNGYFLLFAIFARPTFIVMGMIGGILIFSAAGIALHSLFDIALNLLTVKGNGDGVGNPLVISADKTFYTIIYAYLMYNLATTSFKLIDKVPEQIFRWMGSGAPSFSDGREDPLGRQEGFAVAAGAFVGQQAAGQISSGFQNAERSHESYQAYNQREEQVGDKNHQAELDATKQWKADIASGNDIDEYHDTLSGTKTTDPGEALSLKKESLLDRAKKADENGGREANTNITANQLREHASEIDSTRRGGELQALRNGVSPKSIGSGWSDEHEAALRKGARDTDRKPEDIISGKAKDARDNFLGGPSATKDPEE